MPQEALRPLKNTSMHNIQVSIEKDKNIKEK